MPRLLPPLTALLLLWSCAWLAQTAACSEDHPKKPSYLEATAKHEGKTLAEWTAKLADKDDVVRDQAATAIAQYGPNAKSAVPALIPLLKNPKELPFTSALKAIWAIGPAAGEAVDPLIALLKHDDATIRTLAASTLPDLGPAAGKAVQPLIAALNDKKVGTDEDRDSMRYSLTQIGKYDIRAVYAAVRQDKLNDGDISNVIETLGTADEHAVVGLVAELKGRQADPVTHNWHIYTMAGLKRIGPKAAPALPELRVLLKDKSEIVRGCAAEAIKAIDAGEKGGPKGDAPKKDGPLENIPASPASTDDGFPIPLADIRKELGKPTESDEDSLDYRDKLNVRVSPLGHMEVQAMTSAAGTELTAKLFTSKLFKDEEGKAILELVKAKGGERKVGRFEITAKESAVVSGMIILKITPLTNPLVGGTQKNAKTPEPAPHKRRTVAEWVSELNEGDTKARIEAALAIKAYGKEAEEAVPTLVRALRDKDSFVRGHAAGALGKIARRPDVAVQPLVDALSDPSDFVRFSASIAVGEFGKEAVGPLIKVMREGKTALKFRRHASSALIRVGKSAVPALGEALGDADEEVRFEAALALGEIGPDAVEATPALVKALEDRFFQVRATAAQALGKIRPTSKEAIAALNDALVDRNRLVRIDAFCAIAQIDPRRTEEVVKRLIEYGDEEDEGVAEHAAKAMGRIGKPAVDLLLARLKGATDDRSRIATATQLVAIGKPAVSSLADLFESKEESVRVLAAVCLSQIGPDAKEALPKLREVLKTARGPTARAIDMAIKKIAGEKK